MVDEKGDSEQASFDADETGEGGRAMEQGRSAVFNDGRDRM
jgi:hypothetical protein